MQFLTHLRRLTSAAQSINKVVTFLIKHSSQVSSSSSRRQPVASTSQTSVPTAQEQDLWACIIEELEKSSINAKINIFYMLDSLLDQALAIGLESYRTLVERDLETVVDLTVPTDVKEGVLNRLSTIQVSNLASSMRLASLIKVLLQVLKSWKTRRLLSVAKLDALLDKLQNADFTPSDNTSTTTFSRNDILRRIEDDRERHKRLRERIWVLPVPSLLELSGSGRDAQGKLSTVLSTRTASASPASPASPAQGEPKLVSLAEYARDNNARQQAQEATVKREDAIDVEFEQAWERELTTHPDGSTLDETEWKAMEEENKRCFSLQYL